jgi:hypothetical protein
VTDSFSTPLKQIFWFATPLANDDSWVKPMRAELSFRSASIDPEPSDRTMDIGPEIGKLFCDEGAEFLSSARTNIDRSGPHSRTFER